MKTLLRRISILAIVLFVIGIFASLYHIGFTMPESILESAEIFDIAKTDAARNSAWSSVVFIGTELVLGLFIIVLMTIDHRISDGTNITYVERYAETKNDKNLHQETNKENIFSQKTAFLKHKLENEPLNNKFQLALNALCKDTNSVIGALFKKTKIDGINYIEMQAGYAYQIPESKVLRFEFGEGIAGQVAKEGNELIISTVPQGYITIMSGLGQTTPSNLLVLPIKIGDEVVGVIEIASFEAYSTNAIDYVREVGNYLSEYLSFKKN